MRKVLLTLVAAIFMFTVNAQSIGWAKLASVDSSGINYNNPTIGVNVGGDFDIVLGYSAGSGEFDFAIRKGMSFGFIEVGGFGSNDNMTVSFGRSFGALMDGLNFEPTLTWSDGSDMTMSMNISVSF